MSIGCGCDCGACRLARFFDWLGLGCLLAFFLAALALLAVNGRSDNSVWPFWFLFGTGVSWCLARMIEPEDTEDKII